MLSPVVTEPSDVENPFELPCPSWTCETLSHAVSGSLPEGMDAPALPHRRDVARRVARHRCPAGCGRPGALQRHARPAGRGGVAALAFGDRGERRDGAPALLYAQLG